MRNLEDGLRSRYRVLSDQQLVDLVEAGELTDEAGAVAHQELISRNVSPEDYRAVKDLAKAEKEKAYSEINVPQPPSVKISFVLVLFLFIGEILHACIVQDAKAGANIYSTPPLVLCLLYYIHMVRRIHQIMTVVTAAKYPVTTSKALGFHLIPLFNIYWVIKWPSTLMRHIFDNSGIKGVPGVALGVCLLVSAVIARTFDSAVGYLLVFATMAYLTKMVKKFLAVQQRSQLVGHG